MRTKRHRGAKEFDIVTLVDVVFLMLIFGLIVAAIEISTGGTPGSGKDEKTLHFTFKRVPVPQHPEGPDQIAVTAERLGVQKTVMFPPDEQLITMLPPDWERERAVKLIQNEIEEYHMDMEGDVNPIVVEASEDTPFRIIGYILEQCSRHEGAFPTLRLGALREGEGQEL